MAEKNNYKYKFSVVIPIYNVENYLRETIESVIHQTIGFKENIQIILVNDGSPDNSEAICLEYKEKYPDNIIYVKQENAGVSAARNTGMQYIEGKYTNFLDSDDKWDLNAYQAIYDFFEQHYDEINLVGCRMKFFDAKEDYSHPLDYTFDKGTRVVDIREEPNAIHLHITSSVVKSEIVKNYQFDTNLKMGEDAKFVTTVIMDKQKYGLIADTNLNYRKRANGSSAVQNKPNTLDWYTKTLDYNYDFLAMRSQEKYRTIIPYIQYVIMYDIQWRLKETIPERLDYLKDDYFKRIKALLNQIEDKIILEQRNMYGEYKILALNMKYDMDIRDELLYENGKLYFNNIFVTNTSKRALKIDIMETDKENLYLSGRFSSVLKAENYQVYIELNNKVTKKIDFFEIPHGSKKDANGKVIMKNYGFKSIIPLNGVRGLTILMQYKNFPPKKLMMNFKRMSKLNNEIANAYYSNEKTIVYCKNSTLHIQQNSSINKTKHELKYWQSLLKHRQIKPIVYRAIYFIKKKLKKKEIWLVSDRTMVANDNGMHLFKYICKQNNKTIKPYFVIDKHSPDYPKMKRIGRVLPHGTFHYKLKFLLADKIVSSQADDWVFNAFDQKEIYYRDLYQYQLIFLQHGIIKDDLSGWLQYYNRNFKMFVTSAKREYNSIIQGNYYYDDTVVKLTGLPRYDNLINKPEKIIAIMPTWRKTLSGKINSAEGIREYNPDFKKSAYCKFYNQLMNDKRLLQIMKKKDYQGIFVVHPAHMENHSDFISDYFDIIDNFADYQEIFGKASLLVSDYSSVPFDFAYLRKPVIYTQFDKEEFFRSHLYQEGYFSYDKDGFGPVCYNYEDTVNEIIKSIENDCKMEEKYLQRVENFYQYHDRNNCQRVYEEILKLK